MNLTEKLLAMDAKKYKEKATDKLEIKRLSKMTGEPFFITIQELDDERFQEFQAMLLNDKGKVDYSQVRKINALMCVDGVIEPSLKDEELRKHFGAATPKELAEILFRGNDLGMVADAIANINNFETEDEVKN